MSGDPSYLKIFWRRDAEKLLPESEFVSSLPANLKASLLQEAASRLYRDWGYLCAVAPVLAILVSMAYFLFVGSLPDLPRDVWVVLCIVWVVVGLSCDQVKIRRYRAILRELIQRDHAEAWQEYAVASDKEK